MSNKVLQKNMLLKTRLLNKRFGMFKSLVIRRMQMLFFVSVITKMFSENELASNGNRTKIVIKICEYLYSTRDIWTGIESVSIAFKQKMFDFMKINPNIFQPYLVLFGYICPYPKLDKEICSKEVNGELCSTHKKCKKRLRSRIVHSLTLLPKEISSIVFKYSLPY